MIRAVAAGLCIRYPDGAQIRSPYRDPPLSRVFKILMRCGGTQPAGPVSRESDVATGEMT
ncbi:hypothetical protein FHS43_002126 [Streptosporangium becharense]|uniref:Uncharacterized protein n=1 Tax=Streptosporangium becharense TaxID=1816182 RepID=A0A7W9MES8_9ACTN|nr:hypothetical protein [Streptosporangium becharense]MBB5817558.1 hypothetical protein [Streptosporangium becharense]